MKILDSKDEFVRSEALLIIRNITKLGLSGLIE
jgi:hypothetical protein